jgi:predicted lipase
MAVYLSDKYPNMKITMLNFGAPRVGNEAFKKWSESTLVNLSAWRYVNDHDMVPRMIPNSFGYDHAGHLFQIWEGDYTEVFYRQVGNGSNYAGAPWYWYCKYLFKEKGSKYRGTQKF